MVAVIGGTTLKGMRSTDRLPLFAAGVAYPDWTVFTPNVWSEGIGGVVGAGFWGEAPLWQK